MTLNRLKEVLKIKWQPLKRWVTVQTAVICLVINVKTSILPQQHHVWKSNTHRNCSFSLMTTSTHSVLPVSVCLYQLSVRAAGIRLSEGRNWGGYSLWQLQSFDSSISSSSQVPQGTKEMKMLAFAQCIQEHSDGGDREARCLWYKSRQMRSVRAAIRCSVCFKDGRKKRQAKWQITRG